MKELIPIVPSIGWIALAWVAVFLFKGELKSLMSRGGRFQIGSFSFESAGAGQPGDIAREFEAVESARKLVKEAKSSIEGTPAADNVDSLFEQAAKMEPERISRALVPFWDACVDRLEFTAGLPQRFLNRYVLLKSKNLSEYFAPGGVYLYGYHQDAKCTTLVTIFLDAPNISGQQEIVSFTGAMLGAMITAFESGLNWRLLVGVVPGHVDSVARIMHAIDLFAPATQAGRLQILQLTFSDGMQEALIDGVNQALLDWKREQPGSDLGI